MNIPYGFYFVAFCLLFSITSTASIADEDTQHSRCLSCISNVYRTFFQRGIKYSWNIIRRVPRNEAFFDHCFDSMQLFDEQAISTCKLKLAIDEQKYHYTFCQRRCLSPVATNETQK